MESQRWSGRWCVLLLHRLVPGSGPVWAAAQEAPPQAAEQTAEDAPPPHWQYKLGLEARANFRHSDENRFGAPFPFRPTELPPGQTKGFEETVDAGNHYEISDVTLLGTAGWGDLFTTHLKVDLIDLYDRNPTSS